MLARGDSGAWKRVIHEAPGQALRRGVRDHVVFQVQGAHDQPSFAIVQFHQGRIGQVELTFQQGAPAAAVGLLDGGAGDPAAVAPVPPGVGLVSFVSKDVGSHAFVAGLIGLVAGLIPFVSLDVGSHLVFRVRLDQGAAARPVAQVVGIHAAGDRGIQGEDAPADLRAHPPPEGLRHPLTGLARRSSPGRRPARRPPAWPPPPGLSSRHCVR